VAARSEVAPPQPKRLLPASARSDAGASAGKPPAIGPAVDAADKLAHRANHNFAVYGMVNRPTRTRGRSTAFGREL